MKITAYALKPGFQKLLRPLVRSFVDSGVTANQITVAACLLSCVTGALLGVSTLLSFEMEAWRSPMLLLPFVLLVRMALNAIDGMMAREVGQRSARGAYLNELCDVLSDVFLYVPFAMLGVFDPLWIGVVILLSVISEMAGTVAVMTGVERRYDGPMGKSDRALVFGVTALWMGLGNDLTPGIAEWLPIGMAALLILTIVNRVRKGLQQYAQNTALPALQD